MEKKNFYSLDVWKASKDFAVQIYQITKFFPDDERFGMISQLRRASVSVASNIAEGYERFYFKDKVRFYYISRGSVSELMSILMIAKELSYISVKHFDELILEAERVLKLINGFIRSQKK